MAGQGLAFRRVAVIASPILAGALIFAGFFLDPAIDAEGRDLAAAYAAEPEREQVSALAFHFAFALLAVPTVALVVAVRGRGVTLANAAAVLAVLGMTTLPGFLLTDFYDIAIYSEVGGDGWQAINDHLESLPGATVLFLTGFLGHLLALPVALLGAWRAGLVPWWASAMLLAGEVSTEIVPGAFGLLVWAATLAGLGYGLARWLPKTATAPTETA